MPVVEHQRAAARRDLRIAVRQHGCDQANVVWKCGVDVDLENLGYSLHDPAPAALPSVLLMPDRCAFGSARQWPSGRGATIMVYARVGFESHLIEGGRRI